MSAKSNIEVVGICRFSFLGKGDWKALQGKVDEELTAALARQAAVLFDPLRLEERLKTFSLLTLPSLKAQSDQEFKFIVLASADMPSSYRKRLQMMCDDVPQVILRFLPVMPVASAQKQVFQELGLTFGEVLQFRLDDDDCLCSDFVEQMKIASRNHIGSDPIFTASIRGVLFVSRGGTIPGYYNWPVDFMSAGAAICHPSKSVYEFGHFGMGSRFPSTVIKGRMSLVSHNGTNDTKFNQAIVERRGLTKLQLHEVEEIISKHFLFLSDDARQLISPEALMAPKVDNTSDLPSTQESPSWVNDLTGLYHKPGFFINGRDFALQHTFRGEDCLYVGFDNLSSVRAPSRFRDPWGYTFAARSGWSSLGVMCFQPNWFRISELHDQLHQLSASGFFSKFKRVIFSGTSMGGYAACAFAPLAENSIIVSFSPQSTLSPDIVDWDNRYKSGAKADWSGQFADGAIGVRSAKRAWIVYDPTSELDRRHAERLSGPNVSLLKARYTGHYTAQFLRQIGVMSSFVRQCANESMTEEKFYALYRASREYRRFLLGIAERVAAHPSQQLKLQAVNAFRKINKPGLANDILSTTD